MKHKLLDWEEYQLLRRNIAQYINTLIKHEPEKYLTNNEINRINSYIYDNLDIRNIMGIDTSKDLSNMFYRKIGLVGKPIRSKLYSKLYLLDPSTMPKTNIIDSILSWVDVNGTMIGLSKEDMEQYKTILDKFTSDIDKRIPKLKYGVDYTSYLSEM